jgi:hypothetical protein
MDPARGRFARMDDWTGDQYRPPTLNKYLYADADPVNGMDPSGMATLIETSTAINTSAILTLGVRVASAGSGILVGSRVDNIVKSRTVARACAATFAAGLKAFSAGDCASVRMPIVFMSESLMPGIGEHVMKSQAMGSPAILNRTALLKYTNRALNIAKCRFGVGVPVVNSGSSCDEYPFASTYQGGIGATVAKVDLFSNWVQGGVLSGFYSACLVTPDVFPLNEFLVLPVVSAPGTNFQCRFFGPR